MPESETGPARFATERTGLLLIAVGGSRRTGDHGFPAANAAVFIAMFAGSQTEGNGDEKKDRKFCFHSGMVFWYCGPIEGPLLIQRTRRPVSFIESQKKRSPAKVTALSEN